MEYRFQKRRVRKGSIAYYAIEFGRFLLMALILMLLGIEL